MVCVQVAKSSRRELPPLAVFVLRHEGGACVWIIDACGIAPVACRSCPTPHGDVKAVRVQLCGVSVSLESCVQIMRSDARQHKRLLSDVLHDTQAQADSETAGCYEEF